MSTTPRPPIVAIMGHVDHGKSSLLDAIRRTNIVAGEAGGITQHLSAYEVTRKDESGNDRSITFIDTPGHAAFTHMRTRGAAAADIAILIVSAEEGVKAQTIEAINTIRTHAVPTIVAISKMDRPEANPMRIKTELMEHELFVEGFGGTTSVVEVSSVTGAGIPELLETITLLADLEEFKGDPDIPGEGFVIESHMDGKRGIAATMIIKDGSVTQGQYVVAGEAYASTRIMEDFLGKPTPRKSCSSSIQVVGFDRLPMAGTLFTTVKTKVEAEALATENRRARESQQVVHTSEFLIPLILKTDVAGTGDAIAGQIALMNDENAAFKITRQGVGAISESDVQLAIADPSTIIVGFTVGIDRRARDVQGADKLTIKTFDIIYHLTEWLEEEREKRRPRKTVQKVVGTAQVLKVFSESKAGSVVGARVETGNFLAKGSIIRVLRRGTLLGTGTIDTMQKGKTPATSASEGEEFGMLLKTSAEMTYGDILESVIEEIV